MVKVFIVYGGQEGEGYATTINKYCKQNNIGSFLASRDSADMHAGADVDSRIDDHLLSADIAIIVITSELRDSPVAMSEIDQILHQLKIPHVPYRRKDSTVPTPLLGKQFVEFIPSELSDENELRKLEVKMWRSLDVAHLSIQSSLESQPVEVSYIG